MRVVCDQQGSDYGGAGLVGCVWACVTSSMAAFKATPSSHMSASTSSTVPLLPLLPPPQVLDVLTSCSEYDELPVRHNEDVLNTQLARQVRSRAVAIVTAAYTQ